MLSSLVFATMLLAVSALLLRLHVAAWRERRLAGPQDHLREPAGSGGEPDESHETDESQKADEVDDPTYDYYRRQHRRRMQASAMIGLVGVAVIGGIWIKDPIYSLVYWGCVALLVIWIGLLAAADLVSTRSYFARLRRGQLAEHARLQAELHRIRSREGNGRQEVSKGENSDDESF